MLQRRSRLVVLLTTTLALCVPAAAQAAPSITLDKVVPATTLYGSDIPVTLTAANPAGPGTGYNLSFRDVLPAGVSFVAGSSDPAPTVYANQPAAGQTTLVWDNVSDIAANDAFTLALKVRASPTTFDVGSLVGDTAFAYVNSDPRVVPAFDAGGAVVPPSQTGTATDAAATKLTAIDIVKSGPGALLRGVHDHQYTYTLKTTNNGVRSTTGVTVEDYLPAGLEFLGCAGDPDNTTDSSTNPGSPFEYPGSGPIVVSAVANCRTPVTVETVTIPAGGSGTLTAGVYTHVTWTVGSLAPNATDTLSYRVAVPIRENSQTFRGTTPTITSGDQATNLNNNNGPETFDEQPLANHGIAKGNYQGTGGPVPVSDEDIQTATAEDLVLGKSSDSSALVVGQITRWTLTATASEYRYVDNVRVTDVVPDGLCPLDTVNRESDATADCAPAAGGAPSNPYKTIGENPNGTWTLTWDQTTAPQFTRLQPNASASVSFSTRTRTNYQENGTNAGAVLANDAVQNTATVLGQDYTRCSGGAVDCGTGTKIFAQETDGTDDADAAAAGQTSTAPSIQKTTGTPVGGSCATTTYATTVLRYAPGDRVCFKLRVNFPAETSTGTRPLVDFLPPNVTYDAAAPPTLTAANTLTGTVFDPSDASGGVLRWTLGTAPQTTPAAGKVFEVVFAGRVTGSATYADGAVTGNLMKFTSVDTNGRAFALRDRVDLLSDIPLSLLKGVDSVNGAPAGSNPPNTDNRTVDGGDAVVYRIDLSNTADRAATGIQTWDLLPPGITCAQVSLISDAGACSLLSGSQYVIKWTSLSVAAATISGTTVTPSTKKLTYRVLIPDTFPPGTNLPNTAGIRTYTVQSNTGTPSTFFPASNIDATVTPAQVNTPAASDPSNVRIRGAALTKTRTTSLNETGNTDTQATIGETVIYTVAAVLPKNTTFATGPSITDPVSTRLRYVPGSATATVSSGTAPTVNNASPVTATLPDNYATGAADVTLTLTFQAVVLDTGANARGGTIPNVATFTYRDAGAQTQTLTANVDTTVVEPQVAITKVNSAGGAKVTAGQDITYTVTPSNANSTNVSPAHDARVVDTLPVGITPRAFGTSTAAADGDVVGSSGGVWNATARTITWTPTLNPGASVALTYVARVDVGVVGGVALPNTAVLSSSSLPGASADERSTGTNYNASASSSITPALLSIAKTIVSPSPAKATVGQIARYQLDVTIPAGEQFYDATIRDVLPDDLELVGYVSATCVGTCTPAVTATTYPAVTVGTTSVATWFLGDLTAAAATRTLRLVYDARIRSTRRGGAVKVVDADVAINTANVSSNRTDKITGTPPQNTPPGNGDDVLTDTKTLTVIEPKLTVDKAVAGQVADTDVLTAQPAQTLTYTVAVTNTGTAPAYDATVTDTPSVRLQAVTPATGAASVTHAWTPAEPTLTWQLAGPIAPGASVTLTYTAKLATSGSLTDGQTAVNTVDISPYFGLPASDRTGNPDARSYDDVTPDTVTVTVDLPSLSTVKTTGASGFPDVADARIEQPFSWRVVITNTSTVAQAVGVDAIDVLPPRWKYVAGTGRISSPTVTPSVQTDPAVTSAGNVDTLTWLNATDLAPGESLVVTFDAQLPAPPAAGPAPAVGAANPYVNTARATASDASGASGSAAGPYKSADDTASAVLRSPVLAVTKTPDNGAATAGTSSSFTIKVDNTGDAPATAVDVTDTLPAGLTYAPPATASPSAGFSQTSSTVAPGTGITTIVWRIASIPAGGSVTITLPVAVPAATDPGTYVNTAKAVDAERPDLTPQDTGSLVVGASADVRITKTSEPASNAVPGSRLTYHLLVENLGTSDARAVQVSDPLPAGTSAPTVTPGQPATTTCSVAGTTVTCQLGTLIPGATRTIDVTVTVARTQTATLSNTASVSTTTPDPVPGNNQDTVTTTVAPAADLQVVKTSAKANVLEGQTVDYTLVVTNKGPSTAQAVTLTDTLPAGMTLVSSTPGSPTCTSAPGAAGTTVLTCALGALVDGATRTVMVTARANVGALGMKTNVAQVSSTTPDPAPADNTSSADVIAGPAADLSVVKTAPATVAAGSELTYTLTVRNNGPSPAQQATVSDVLPTGTSFVRATTAMGTCVEQSGKVTCALGTLPGNTTVVVSITVAIPLALADQTVANTATVGAANGDPDPSNNSSTVQTLVGPVVDLGIVKTGTARSAPGQLVTYTLAVTNKGPSAATAADVTDTLPSGLTFVSATPAQGTCSASGAVVSCALGALASGASTQVLITARVADGQAPGTLTNTATVTGPEPDPNPADNTSSATTTIDGGPVGTSDLQITKTPSTTQPRLGAQITYVIEVTNLGPATAVDTVAIDTLPATLTFVSASPTQGTCSGTRTVTCKLGDVPVGRKVTILVVATVDRPGSIDNNASVAAANPDSKPASNIAVAGVRASAANARLTIIKRALKRRVKPGALARWSLTIKNPSKTPALDVVVCDRIPSQLTLVSAGGGKLRDGVVCWTRNSLKPGASFTVRLSTRVLRGTKATGVTNTATAVAGNARKVTARARVAVDRAGLLPRRASGVTG